MVEENLRNDTAHPSPDAAQGDTTKKTLRALLERPTGAFGPASPPPFF